MTLAFRSYGKLLSSFLLITSFIAFSAAAQDYSAMGVSDIVSSANLRLKRGDYAGAIPPLQEVIDRFMGLTDPAKIEVLQNARFQLARAHYKMGDIPAGMEVLEEYLQQEPRKQERMALRMVAQGLFEVSDWDKIEKVATQLLALPDLSPDDRLNATLMLGQALFQTKKWKECIVPLTYMESESKDKKSKQAAQIMIVRALVEAENWSELFVWIPRVYRTDAKYDITLNLTAMKAAKALFKQNDALNSLVLYRMVLPREVLIGFSNKRIAQLSRKLAKDEKVGITEKIRKERLKEIEEIRSLIEKITELPPYEDEVAFRIGKIYHELLRYWEGYVLFEKLYSGAPDSEIGSAAILELVLTLYDLQETDRAEEQILNYLEARITGKSARMLLSMMMRDNLLKQNGEKVIGLQKYLDRLPATTDADEVSAEGDLHYMMAFGYFQTGDHKASEDQFNIIITDFQESQRLPDSYYYLGMTHMMRAEYQKAIDAFKAYQEKYPEGEHFSDAIFRQGVCFFGLNNTVEAKKVFTLFVDTYPTDKFVSEAYSMRGDIEAAKNGQDDPKTPDVDEYDPHTLDRALVDYRKAMDTSSTSKQAAYAVFQAAEVYKLEFKWQEIIDLMKYYLELKGADADVAQAVFWIGKAQISMGQIDEAIDAYLNAILTFGSDVDQEGVDKIIDELISIAEYRLTDEDRELFAIKLKLKMTDIDPDEKVLLLRLKITLALLAGEEETNALGSSFFKENQNLNIVTPISLAVLCNVAVAEGDTEQMGRLYDYFVENFEDSDKLWTAYRAKTYQLLASDDLIAVTNVIEEAQGLYGADSFMGWSQITKGDTLLKLKLYDEAEAAYNTVMGVPAWRGPLYAEAMYGMGECRLAKQDFEGAHNFFQRTYLLFKAYANGEWAAKGYLAAADCLLELDRKEDAVKTWKDMIENDYVNTLPDVETAKKMIKKYGDA